MPVCKARPADLPAIGRIADICLGKGYWGAWAHSLRLWVVRENDKIIGFAGVRFLQKKENSPAYLQRFLPESQKAAVLKIIAIEPSCQGKGYGALLFEKTEACCRKNNCQQIFVPAWQQGETLNLRKMLKKRGYVHKQSFPGFWKEACQKREFLCPARREKCVCSMQLFSKKTG